MTRELYFYNPSTGETAGRVDVTGKSDRTVERTMRGMLINIHSEWIVMDTAWDNEEPTP